ncbi:thioredoxin domain-containing protein, partial [Candidatus Venteria ishoeyi]
MFKKLFLIPLLVITMPHIQTVTQAATHPGATAYPDALQQKLQQRLQVLGSDYKPRTEHLEESGQAQFNNRLLLEDSPYLQQHAHNPVDWYPWGKAAFARAKAENKPIFLSIGYATCHWCHVMEKESFEDLEIAHFLNQHFIAIKVDREQRPDIDDIYMNAVLIVNGSGGWPMSSFLASDGKPFYNGTYFPPQRFLAILQQIQKLWLEQQPQLLAQAEQISARVAQYMGAEHSAQALGEQVFPAAMREILQRQDNFQGGFGQSQKFPHETWLFFLLKAAESENNALALDAVKTALDAMQQGGIHDQIGGGFHRYTVDPEWLTPHFEKMLYNQAQLAQVYLLAYRLTGNQLYARAVRQILDYVLRDMTDSHGGFYSATDADSRLTPESEAEEGLFFLWTPAQIKAALPADLAKLTIDVYGLTKNGNFEGRNILYLEQDWATIAKQHQQDLPVLLKKIDAIRETLYQVRQQRSKPLRDEKILTAWNGRMIMVLAEAALLLEAPHYLSAAQKAAQFLLSRSEAGQLWRVSLHGQDSIPGNLEDYAGLIEALNALYDADGDKQWLHHAQQLADSMIKQFQDSEQGGFFLSIADEHLMIRPKSPEDGAEPSGNATALRALVQLAARSGETRYLETARNNLAAFAGQIQAQPASFGYLLVAAQELLRGSSAALRYLAQGNIKIHLQRDFNGDDIQNKARLSITMQQGWHINANQPLQKSLIATEIFLHSETKPDK